MPLNYTGILNSLSNPFKHPISTVLLLRLVSCEQTQDQQQMLKICFALAPTVTQSLGACLHKSAYSPAVMSFFKIPFYYFTGY